MIKKLNWIDYIIISVFLFIIFILGTKIYNINSSKSFIKGDFTKKDVVLKMENVRKYYIDALNIGDNVYLDETDNYFGKIKDIEANNAEITLVKNNGDIVSVKSPIKYDIILTIECNMVEQDNSYLAEGLTEVNINSFNTYKTIGAVFDGLTYRIGE